MTEHADLLGRGLSEIGVGNFTAGMRAFESAYAIAATPPEIASSLQCIGITLRLMNDLVTAELILREALSEAGQDTILAARIERDLAMTILDLATETQDREIFVEADALLLRSWASLIKTEPLEASATVGFMARSLLEQGEKRDAISLFHDAHKALTNKHDVYELNNLVWLARASVLERWHFAFRAFRLIRRTNSTRRAKEYLVILVGGNRLYAYLKTRQRK